MGTQPKEVIEVIETALVITEPITGTSIVAADIFNPARLPAGFFICMANLFCAR